MDVRLWLESTPRGAYKIPIQRDWDADAWFQRGSVALWVVVGGSGTVQNECVCVV